VDIAGAAKPAPPPEEEMTEGKPKRDLTQFDPGSQFTDPAMAAAARRRAETMPFIPLTPPRRSQPSQPVAGTAAPRPAAPPPAAPKPVPPAAPAAQPVPQTPPATAKAPPPIEPAAGKGPGLPNPGKGAPAPGGHLGL
jgi:translation initiation factor IF-2